jgi:hypothetical protein
LSRRINQSPLYFIAIFTTIESNNQRPLCATRKSKRRDILNRMQIILK